MGEENRIYKRLKMKINVRYQAMDANHQLVEEQYSVAQDLSAGGMVLTVHEKYEKGAVLQITIELPDSNEPITCLSRIVRINKNVTGDYDAAVCYLDLSGKDRLKLEQFISKET